MRNLLLNEKNELHNRSMHVSGTFSKKQDIDTAKQDIGAGLSPHQKKQLERIAEAFGKETVFGRSDIMNLFGITASPASALIKKLLEAGKIETVTGCGKGKYIVRTEQSTTL